MTVDDLDEDGAERPRLPRAVMDRRSRPGPELTTLAAVGNQWRYALLVVQAGDDDDDECIDRRYRCTKELDAWGRSMVHGWIP